MDNWEYKYRKINGRKRYVAVLKTGNRERIRVVNRMDYTNAKPLRTYTKKKPTINIKLKGYKKSTGI